jgi:hypothetical protein
MYIAKYGRHWAVYASDDTLICVCVYKKGALEVVRRLQGVPSCTIQRPPIRPRRTITHARPGLPARAHPPRR